MLSVNKKNKVTSNHNSNQRAIAIHKFVVQKHELNYLSLVS